MRPTHEAIVEVSRRSGLSQSTVREMLKHGWTYSETINEPAKWISPVAQFKDVGK